MWAEHTCGAAYSEWISYKSISTCANWTVIIYTTLCISAAHVRRGARIHTFLIHTRLIKGAFRWYDAFRPTSRRTSNETGQTRADCDTVIIFAIAIGAAGTRATHVNGLILNCWEYLIENSNSESSDRKTNGRFWGSGLNFNAFLHWTKFYQFLLLELYYVCL